MADRNPGPSPQERDEVDDLHRRLPSISHYELLGVDPNADPTAITRAYGAKTRQLRTGSFAGPLAPQLQQRIDAIVAAMERAHAVLSDPVRRYLYDQDRPSPSTAPPAASSSPPQGAPNPLKRTPTHGTFPSPPPGTARPAGYTPVTPPTAIAPRGLNVPSSDPLAPLDVSRDAKPVSAPPPDGDRGRPAFKPPTAPQPDGEAKPSRIPAPTPPHGTRSATSPTPPPPRAPTPPPFERDAPELRSAALESQVQTLQGEVSTLLSEVERLAVSVQLAIAYALEPGSVKAEQLIAAGQALVSSRVAVASLLARREEGAGRWEAAAALWQRASRARPGEVMLLVRAADALRKAGGDLAAAESLARQAIELDPDCAEAHAALAVIETRRNQNP